MSSFRTFLPSFLADTNIRLTKRHDENSLIVLFRNLKKKCKNYVVMKNLSAECQNTKQQDKLINMYLGKI